MPSLSKLTVFLILCCIFLASAPALGAIVYLDSFGSQGSGDGQFDRLASLAIGTNGDVYVVDTGNNRVQQFFDPDAWTTGYYPIDDDPATPAVNDASLGAGNPLGDSLTIDATRNLCVAGDLRVIGAGSLALTGGTLFIGSDAVTPTAERSSSTAAELSLGARMA